MPRRASPKKISAPKRAKSAAHKSPRKSVHKRKTASAAKKHHKASPKRGGAPKSSGKLPLRR